MHLSKFRGIHVVSRGVLNVLTFGTSIAITLFPFVFYLNKNVKANPITRNHESIHIRQQMECALVGVLVSTAGGLLFSWTMWVLLPGAFLFYLIYGVEFIIKAIKNKSWYGGYINLSFEREAYLNSNRQSYISLRKSFAWIRYMRLA